jgi:hypothetical protein
MSRKECNDYGAKVDCFCKTFYFSLQFSDFLNAKMPSAEK